MQIKRHQMIMPIIIFQLMVQYCTALNSSILHKVLLWMWRWVGWPMAAHHSIGRGAVCGGM